MGNLIRRARSLNELRSGLILLRGDVEYASATLPEAVGRIAGRAGREQDFFGKLIQRLEKEDGVSFAQKWKEAVEETAPMAALRAEDVEELNRLGEYLGQQNKESQLRHLDWYLQQSEEALAEIRKGEKEKVHLYRMLSVLGGAFLCIILI